MKLQNIVDCSNNDAIMSSIKCELKSCPNKAGWCYIVDNVHLKILPAHIKTWSIAINDGTATLDMPPTILVKSLMPAKQSLSNPMRDPYSKSSNSGSTPTPSSGTAVHVPAPTPPPQIIYQMMPHGYQHPYGLPTRYHGTPEPPQLHHNVRSSRLFLGQMALRDWPHTFTGLSERILHLLRHCLRPRPHWFKEISSLIPLNTLPTTNSPKWRFLRELRSF